MENRELRLGAAFVAVVAAGAFAFNLTEIFARYPDRAWADELWRQGRYFTNLTTCMLAVAFAGIAVTGRVSARWGLALAYWSVIVGVVYHTLLARDLTGARWWADQGLHTLVPFAVAGWWLWLAPKRGLDWHNALFWLSWPAIYLAYALVRGEIDGLHPYFFIDPPLIGWPKVVMWCCAMALAFWLTGLAIVWACRTVMQALPPPEGDGPAGLPPRSPTGPDQTTSDG